MTEFKVGDRVRRINYDNGILKVGDEGVIDRLIEPGDCLIKGDRTAHSYKNLVLVKEGPVRTVTRREIVPGEYGHIRTGGVEASGFVRISLVRELFNTQELRSAAMVFSQIAEALEDQK